MNLGLEIKSAVKHYVFFSLERLAPFFDKNKPIVKSGIKKILVAEVGGVGDLLRIFPAINALHANFPCASISILVSPASQDVLSLHPNKSIISKFYNFDAKGINRGFIKKLLLLLSLRKNKFDLTYFPSRGEGMNEHVLMNFIIGAPHRLGFKRGQVGLLNTIKIEFRDDIPILKQNLSILKAANIEVESEEIKLALPEGDITYAKKLLEENKFTDSYPLITLHPGALWNAKYRCWPLENYISLIKILIRDLRAKIVIIGSKSEMDTGERILSVIKEPDILSMIGKTTLPQMTAIINISQLFIGSDSGPLHLASGMKVPFIGLFGPTSPEQVLSNTTTGIILSKTLSCAPCYLHEPLFEPPCNAVNTPKCMEMISVEDVLKAARKIMSDSKTNSNLHSKIDQFTPPLPLPSP